MKSFAVLGITFLVLIGLALTVGSKLNVPPSNQPHYEHHIQPKNTTDDKYRQNYKRHPILDYQKEASMRTQPAFWGDPIRPPYSFLGPNRTYDNVTTSGMPYDDHRYHYNANKQAYAYDSVIPYVSDGPHVGERIGVPVPSGAFKITEYPFFYQQRPLLSQDYFKPYGEMPFVSSVDAFAPFPEINTPWEKIGIVKALKLENGTIMNLYRRPIAPLQDLFEYMVQDKNGFVIPLKNNKYLEDGDVINHIQGYESVGPWKCNIFVRNKWIMM